MKGTLLVASALLMALSAQAQQPRSAEYAAIERGTDLLADNTGTIHPEGTVTPIFNLQSGVKLKMYPVPTNGAVTAECLVGMLKIVVRDNHGTIVLTNADLHGAPRFRFDIKVPGTYKVSVLDREGESHDSFFIRSTDVADTDHSVPVQSDQDVRSLQVETATPFAGLQKNQNLRVVPELSKGRVTAECLVGMVELEVRDHNGSVVLRNYELNGAQRFVFEVVEPGNYTVTVVDRENRKQQARFVRITNETTVERSMVIPSEQAEPAHDEGAATLISGTQNSLHLRMFPVPTNGAVTADCQDGMLTIEVRDMNGRLVMRDTELNGTKRFTFDIGRPGTYMVDIVDRSGHPQRSRFIRQ